MAVRAIDWKCAIGAELTGTGFDASVLSRYRARLADQGLERVVFDRLLEHCKDAGLVGAGGKQRTDSTHVISAVRELDRLELAGGGRPRGPGGPSRWRPRPGWPGTSLSRSSPTVTGRA